MSRPQRAIAAASFAVFAVALAPAAFAQAFPSKPLRMVIPFAPGGGSDFIGRIAAQQLTESLGQTVVVENRGGAGGSLGVEIGMKAAPDGYTLTLIAASYPVNPALYKLNFDPIKDIQPVIQMSQGPFLVAVHPTLPVKTVKDLIALARKSPGGLNYATSGQGSIVHLATEHFSSMAGIKMTHIPYKGTGPALTDTIGGHTQLIFGSIASTLPFVRSGKLRPIAVTTAKRIAAEPNIPSIGETVPGYDVTNWHGILVPRNTPRPIVDRINGDLQKALSNKEMISRLNADGVEPAGGTPEAFGARIAREIELWRKIVAQAGVKAE
ncbi:MAG: tripartite tricarboxylate transporter substrate binding protein [Burkholderiales bacterium]|nr:tripartite tricarboxylate transporter substrate binding protein [Burkholderiales bacterium]